MFRTSLLLFALLALTGLSACGGTEADGGSDLATRPSVGACRLLKPADIEQPTNASRPVDCSGPHTAETFVVGSFTGKQHRREIDDEALAAQAYETCQSGFMDFLGGDESLVMRSTLTWAWFRPPEKGWDDGARWFRCDVIGGGDQSKAFVHLPKTAEGLLLGRPDDRWMVCATGATVTGSVKIPCTQSHDWRAVSTVQVGQPDERYPGDKFVEVKTRGFCSDQVGAWLDYPVEDYDFGYTWFHEGEWKAGNRRSVCWAKTDE